MNDLRCLEIDDRLVGYAASALDGDEGCAVAVHLAECRQHDAELMAIRADLEALALAVTPVEPPARLRSSLLDAFHREVAGNAAPAPQSIPASRPLRAQTSARGMKRGLFASAGLGYALAAALLVIAVGLGAWGLSRAGGSKAGIVLATATEAGHTMQLTYLKEQHLAVLDVELSPPPEGHTYQAWQMVDGAPLSLGVLNTHSGQIAFAADLDKASAVALSVEPASGSEAPTTTPILVTQLPES